VFSDYDLYRVSRVEEDGSRGQKAMKFGTEEDGKRTIVYIQKKECLNYELSF